MTCRRISSTLRVNSMPHLLWLHLICTATSTIPICIYLDGIVPRYNSNVSNYRMCMKWTAASSLTWATCDRHGASKCQKNISHCEGNMKMLAPWIPHEGCFFLKGSGKTCSGKTCSGKACSGIPPRAQWVLCQALCMYRAVPLTWADCDRHVASKCHVASKENKPSLIRLLIRPLIRPSYKAPYKALYKAPHTAPLIRPPL